MLIDTSSIDNEKTLICVVDMVNGFCKDGALSSSLCKEVILPIKNLLHACKNARKAFIRDSHTEQSVEFRTFPPHCHTPFESSMVDELCGFDAIDVPKNSTNAFFSLSKRVDLLSYENIVVVGVCTDICVLQLALTLRAYFNEENHAANVITLSELCQTFDMEAHEAQRMNEVSFELLSGAGVKVYTNIKEN